jgi:hypothetical protein
LFNPAAQGSSVYRSRMTGGDLPLPENEEGGNALDPELGRKLRFGFYIDFHKAGSWLELLGGCLKYRGHCAAGPTPGSPEICHHRNVIAGQVLLEACTAQGDRLTLEELGTTLAALG